MRGFAEFLGIEDLVGHIAAEERGIAGHLTPLLHGLNVQRIFQRGGFGFVVLGFRDELLLKHQVQHNISLFFSGFLIGLDRRIVFLRVLGDCRDGGRLNDGKVRRGRVEVAFRRRFHAVQAAGAELGDIQIPLQNLVFGVFLLHLHGDEHLSQLARDGVL